MKTKLLILSGLTVLGAGVWYLLKKNNNINIQQWTDEAADGPIKDHLTILEQVQEPADIRELMHRAKGQA